MGMLRKWASKLSLDTLKTRLRKKSRISTEAGNLVHSTHGSISSPGVSQAGGVRPGEPGTDEQWQYKINVISPTPRPEQAIPCEVLRNNVQEDTDHTSFMGTNLMPLKDAEEDSIISTDSRSGAHGTTHTDLSNEVIRPYYSLDPFEFRVERDSLSAAPTEAGLTTECDGGRDSERQFLRELRRSGGIIPVTFEASQSLPEDVRTVLGNAKKENALNPARDFITCVSLHSIITYDTVCLLLRHCDGTLPDDQIEVYAKQIIPNEVGTAIPCRRLLAILVMTRKLGTIFEFLAPDTLFDDSLLPVNFNRGGDPTPDIFIDNSNWTSEDIKDFSRVQWEVLPIFFAERGDKIVHYECRPGEILPIMIDDRGLVGRGAYGEVTSYTLHEDQQHMRRYTKQGKRRSIAVKKLTKVTNREEFDQEHSMLDRLTLSLDTPHLVKLLSTYEVPRTSDPRRDKDYYMVFECADRNLLELWNSIPDDMSTTAGWIAKQSLGLATALSCIHRFRLHRKPDDPNDRTRGFHGDLKPDNILLYKDWLGQEAEELGVLQITDFGLSSFHHTDTVENIRFHANSGDYRPPETQLFLDISYSLDVWALGCISLEFLTWLLKGQQGVKEFTKARSSSRNLWGRKHTCFWQVDEKNGITTVSLAQAVIDHATMICRSQETSQFVRDFCKLIITEMLVVEDKGIQGQQEQDVETSNEDQPSKRIEAPTLVTEMRRLVTDDATYYTPSIPTVFPDFRSDPRHCIRIHKPLGDVKVDAGKRRDAVLYPKTSEPVKLSRRTMFE